MGDPKRIRKKYETPFHPWIKSRIEEEKRLSKEFGTANKKELWKMETVLKKFKDQTKKLLSDTSKQGEIETDHLFRKIKELGLAEGDVTFDTVLGLKIEDVLGRRLQSIVYKKGLAKTVKQARQFIVHEHIKVDGKVITSPSYLVSVKEEVAVGFTSSSSLFSEDHPERASAEKLAEIAENKKAKAKAEVDAEAKAKAKKATDDAKAENAKEAETANVKEAKVESKKVEEATKEKETANVEEKKVESKKVEATKEKEATKEAKAAEEKSEESSEKSSDNGGKEE